MLIYNVSLHGTPPVNNSAQKRDEAKILISKMKTNGIDRTSIDKVNKYVNNRLGWSALNYAVHEKDYKSAMLIAEHCRDINRKDSLHIEKESQIKFNALSRLLNRAYYSWIYEKRSQSERQTTLTDEQSILAHKLIDKGIDCDEIDSSALTPICYCVYLGEKDLVAKLLDKGADINISNKSGGGILLSSAVASAQIDLVSYLISRGAIVQLVDGPGDSILHSAILSQKQELVELALDYGCDISKIDAVGIAINYTYGEVRSLNNGLYTPLPALEMVQFLLARGANPNFWIEEWIENQNDLEKSFRYSPLGKSMNLIDGFAPLFCQEWYQQYLIKMLLDYGAVLP